MCFVPKHPKVLSAKHVSHLGFKKAAPILFCLVFLERRGGSTEQLMHISDWYVHPVRARSTDPVICETIR